MKTLTNSGMTTNSDLAFYGLNKGEKMTWTEEDWSHSALSSSLCKYTLLFYNWKWWKQKMGLWRGGGSFPKAKFDQL